LLWSTPKFWLGPPAAAEVPELAPLPSWDLPDIASLKVLATSPATSFSPSDVSPRSSATLFRRSPALPAASCTLSPRFLGGVLQLLMRAAKGAILDVGGGK
jgi:hypothetical protein